MGQIDFIHIGPGRSGTTWIYNALLAHPDICMAKDTKETCFFDDNYDKGEEWYKGFFKHCDNSKIKGEVSNLYIFNEKVPKRIYETVPDVKLIICLRNPLDRIRSVYQFMKRNEFVKSNFENVIDNHPEVVADNYYWKHINSYLQYFNEEQIKILFFEDLKDNPSFFLKELYGFLEVSTSFEPEFLNKKINSSAQPRVPFLGTVSKIIARKLRQFEMYKLLDFLKWNPLVRNVILREVSEDEKQHIIPDYLEDELSKKYEDDIKSIMEFTNRDLKHWLN